MELGEYSEAGTLYLDAAERFSETPIAADCLFLAGLVFQVAGEVIGVDAFSYTSGAVDGLQGGTGWD